MKQDISIRKSSPFASFGLGHIRDYFIEDLSLLVASGMPILEAIDASSADVRSRKLRRIVLQVTNDIESGLPLWQAFETSGLFHGYTISLMRIGEESGRLSQNLKLISLQQEKERVFRSKIRSAMLYPIFVLSLTLFIGFGIAWFTLPKISLVFSQLDLELPMITKVLIRVGNGLHQFGIVIIPLILGLFVSFIYLCFYLPKTKWIGQNFLFVIPGVKQLIQEVELSRFGYLLGTLLEAGIPIEQAIRSLSQATEFVRYSHFYEYLALKIEEGNSFQKSFNLFNGVRRLFPVPTQHLVMSGEKSGQLIEALLSINRTYDSKTETTTKNLSVILEPVLLVIVWLGVVMVALAVILPIYSLIGGINSVS